MWDLRDLMTLKHISKSLRAGAASRGRASGSGVLLNRCDTLNPEAHLQVPCKRARQAGAEHLVLG